MLSIVGPGSATEFPLPIQTDELQAELDALYDAGRLSELIDPHSLLSGIQGDWYTPPVTEWPRPRLGQIYWPVVGRARYAFACLLVDEYTVGQLRTQLSGGTSTAVTIKLRDDPDNGAETARSVPMYFLAARPLVRTTAAALTTTDDGLTPVDAWVLLLVDARYSELQRSATLLVSAAWSDVFSSLTIDDAVDGDYLIPGTRWTLPRIRGRSFSWLLDAASLAVGSRIVTGLDAVPHLQRPTATHKATLATAHTAAGTRFLGGGPIENSDVAGGLPYTIQHSFGSFDEGTPVLTNLVGTGAVDITLLMSTWVDAPASTSGGNRSALAAQWGTDWEAWQYGAYDTTYSGFVTVPISGFCWAVEYFHSAGQGYTKFIRAPHRYGYLVAPANGAPPAAPASAIPSTPTDSIPTLDGAGNLQATPSFATADPYNGDPATQQFQYTDPASVTQATDPHFFQQSAQDIDGAGNPGVQQAVYPTGTGGGPVWSQTAAPAQVQQMYDPTGATPAYQTASTFGGQVQFQQGNAANDQGLFRRPAITAGNVTQFQQSYMLWTGAAIGTPLVQTITPTQYQQTYTPTGSTAAYQTVTTNTGQVQFQQGNSAGDQGSFNRPTVSSGNVTQYQQGFALWDAVGAAIRTALLTYTATTTGITATAPSTYTGDYGSSAGFKLPASGNTTIGGHAVTLAGAVTTSGANALTLTTTGTTSVTMPTSGTLLSTASTGIPQWTKYTVGYAAIAALGAVTSGTVVFGSLPAKGIPHLWIMKCSTAFAGGTIASLSLGAGFPTLGPFTASGLDGLAAVDDTNVYPAPASAHQAYAVGIIDYDSATDIELVVNADANLDQLTAGSIDVWILTSVLP